MPKNSDEWRLVVARALLVNQSRSLLSGPDRQAKGERGASLVEYALLVGLIALVCIVALVFFGSSVSNNFNRTGSSVTKAGS